MNSYISAQNIALGVVYFGNFRAHAPDKYISERLDSPLPLLKKGLSRNLLRPDLISASVGTSGKP